MRKIMHRPLLYLLAGIGLGSCTSSQVVVDRDPQADVYAYRTFQFTDVQQAREERGNPLYYSSLIDRSIHAYIAGELIARHMEEVDTAADMMVAYHTYTERKRGSVNEYYPMMYGGWYWRFHPWGLYPYPYIVRHTYTYTEGTLIIDLIDARTRRLVWRGSIAGAVGHPAELPQQVERAVKLIFKKYPIPPDYNRVRPERIMARH